MCALTITTRNKKEKELQKIIPILNEVHDELLPLIDKVDAECKIYLSKEEYNTRNFMFSLIYPHDKKYGIWGDVSYIRTEKKYVCGCYLDHKLDPNDKLPICSMVILEDWLTSRNAKDDIRCYLLDIIKEYFCLVLNTFDVSGKTVPKDLNDILLDINKEISICGNIPIKYTKDIVNNIIAIHNSVYEMDLGYGITLLDLADTLDDIYDIGHSIPTSIEMVKSKNDFSVELLDMDGSIILHLKGKNLYEESIDVNMRVRAGLYLESHDEIVEYMISSILRALDCQIDDRKWKIHTILNKYEESGAGQCLNIKKFFGI